MAGGEIKHHAYVPGWSTSSPCSRLLRVKSVGWYLGFCQNNGRLRLTTSAMGTSFFESFTRDTWMRLPSGSIWWTKFAVALENITLAYEKWQSWKKAERQRSQVLICVFPRRQRLGSVLVPSKNPSKSAHSRGVGEVLLTLILIHLQNTHTHTPLACSWLSFHCLNISSI